MDECEQMMYTQTKQLNLIVRWLCDTHDVQDERVVAAETLGVLVQMATNQINQLRHKIQQQSASGGGQQQRATDGQARQPEPDKHGHYYVSATYW